MLGAPLLFSQQQPYIQPLRHTWNLMLLSLCALYYTGNAPVAVTGLDPGSVAEASGLCVGDTFVVINEEHVYFLPQKEVVGRIKAQGTQPFTLFVKTVRGVDEKVQRKRKGGVRRKGVWVWEEEEDSGAKE